MRCCWSIGALAAALEILHSVAAAPDDAASSTPTVDGGLTAEAPLLQHGPVQGLSFVQRRGSQLLVDGKPTRFAGANAYWLGLDENVVVNGSKVNYPTHFRVDDAFETAAGMGALVIRAHTVGVSTGNPLSFEPKLGVFAEGDGLASDHIDYAIYRAGISGIRLIVPLTDNYAYFHGGKHDFVDWVDPEMEHRANCVLPLCVKEPEARLCPFYTNPRVIDGFKQYIKSLLNHVNQYTGIALKNDPAIMGWETGNELNGVSANWTNHIANFIKIELGAKQLVFDGIDSERLGGVAKLDPAELAAKNVDCYTDHYYPPKPAMLVASAAAARAAGKVYYVGEYQWKVGDLELFLQTIERTHECTASLYWSLFPHADDHGYVSHADGNTLHWPGDTPSQQKSVTLLRAHAYAMRGMAVPPLPRPTGAPLITSAISPLLAWRGVAMAATYTVQRAVARTGPWTTICESCATDMDTPWRDTSRGTDTPNGTAVFYRVRANGGMEHNASVGFGPWSQVVESAYKPQLPPGKCTWEANTDYNPHSLPGGKEAHAVSRDDCCNKCIAYVKCGHAVFNEQDGGCWMKPTGSEKTKGANAACTPPRNTSRVQ